MTSSILQSNKFNSVSKPLSTPGSGPCPGLSCVCAKSISLTTQGQSDPPSPSSLSSDPPTLASSSPPSASSNISSSFCSSSSPVALAGRLASHCTPTSARSQSPS